MIGWFWTRVRKQPIIVLRFEFMNEQKGFLTSRPGTAAAMMVITPTRI